MDSCFLLVDFLPPLLFFAKERHNLIPVLLSYQGYLTQERINIDKSLVY